MDTPRLHLRKISVSDLDDFHAIWSNEEATQWSSTGPKKTLEESRSWLNGILPEVNPDGDNYAVFVRSKEGESRDHEKRMIGIVGVYSFSPAPELGYTFHPDVWGRGYATEALKAFLDVYWKLRPNVSVIEAKTDVENVGSIRVLEKSGFSNVETLKGCIVLPKKGLRDSYVFRIQRP
ncbi:GNAT domain-containing protein [Xylogone sp. PMI_703]|nr:GNAT domain-containing protein [Xylogone sp. PMI_703]